MSTKGFPLTSSVIYALHIADGFGYIFLCCFDEGVLPGRNAGVERDESKVVFLVEVIQNGRQSHAGLYD